MQVHVITAEVRDYESGHSWIEDIVLSEARAKARLSELETVREQKRAFLKAYNEASASFNKEFPLQPAIAGKSGAEQRVLVEARHSRYCKSIAQAVASFGPFDLQLHQEVEFAKNFVEAYFEVTEVEISGTEGRVLIADSLVRFLNGEIALDGCWFGDPHPKGNFWWRALLPTTPSSEQSSKIKATS